MVAALRIALIYLFILTCVAFASVDSICNQSCNYPVDAAAQTGDIHTVSLLQVGMQVTSHKDTRTRLDATYINLDEDKLHTVQQSGSSFPIDFVYCWSGLSVLQDDDSSQMESIDGDHSTGQGFGELRYSIQLLEAYAPWFHKVYILVNTEALERPTWLTEASKDKIEMIDRCSLFDRSEDCPTENDSACRAVMHKIPGLSEHFVALDDDFLVVRPLSPSDFFASQGKPLVFAEGSETGVPIYSDKPQGPDMPPEQVPKRAEWFDHVPVPNLVSFAWKLEKTYPDWFSFVRSHRHRFTCCNTSTAWNGYAVESWPWLDEDFQRVYPHMLLQSKVGTKHSVQHAVCENSEERYQCMTFPNNVTFGSSLSQSLEDPQMTFLVLQEIDDVATWHAVQKDLDEHIQGMPSSEFVVNSPSTISS